ncbi:MAG TPA: transcriptional repressor [Synergistaceae bacterium]|nr:MAG: Ferric uptake regulator, Fur family [Synergistales bacterium 58_81]HBG14877.1 transcriptional repressor [Synergistaceae bacterium]HCP08100.1 transcriptional repressor [Synergistaceae bacterium]
MNAWEILERKSIRATPARKSILEVLLKERCPLSYREVAARLPEGQDRVTLYRTLLLLFKEGIVHRVLDMKGTWRFCAHDSGHPGCPGNHPHFACRVCGRMECLIGSNLPFVEVEPGTEVEGKHMVIYGVCRDCLVKRTKKRGAGSL